MAGESATPSDMATERFAAGWHPARRMAAFLVVYGFVIWAVTALTFWSAPFFGNVLPFWPATPIAIAALVRYPRRTWPLLLAAVAIGILAAVPVLAPIRLQTATYVVVDAIQTVLVASLLQIARPDPRLLRGYFTVVGIGVLGAMAGTASFGIVRLALGEGGDPNALVRWFSSGAMGMIVLLPAFKATRRALSEEIGLLSPAMVVVIALTALGTGAIFMSDRYPALFLLMPCGVFAALLYRFAGAAAATLTVSAMALVCTAHGIGPFAAVLLHLPDRILLLQLFIAVFTLTTFPIAALLYEQSLALKGLRDNERQLRLLTDHSTDLIVRLGMDGLGRYASPAAERLLGYRPEQLVGKSPFEAIHPDDRDRVRRCLEQLTPDGDGVVFRYRMRHRDGHYLWLEGAFRLVGDGDDTLELIGSIRDIATRRDAETEAIVSADKLEERQRLLGMAETAAGIGHWRLNLGDWRLFWSSEVFRIHGVTEGEEPRIADAIDFYHVDDRAMVRERLGAVINSGGAFEFDARIVRRDGTMRWVRSRGQAEPAPGAGIVSLFGVLQDITEQVAAMTDLRAAREEAERALADKATFTATISHEIRTPLTSILAAAQLLRDTPDRTERMRHLDSLEKAGRTLSDIVDDVLTFSKLEGGHGNPEAIAFEPRQLLETVIGLFAVDARRHDLTLELDAPPGRVIGDPARVQRVLTNLVGNAVKFTRAGSIRISAARVGGELWRFEVADTGVGIRSDRLDAIFEPFVQADASTTRSYGGTGLGLSISRMLVGSMRGTIHVASRPGTGSSFWFDLPLPAAAVVDAEAAMPASGGPDAADPSRPVPVATVLVAEDNDTNRYLIAEIVRRLGHRVVTVENGARAVEYVTAPAGNPVDLVLMDIQMPVMDGIAAARAIRAWSGAGATVPIHAITADQSTETRAEIRQAGIDGILAKPVDMIRLGRLLGKVADDLPPAAASAVPTAAIDPERIRSLTDALGAEQRDMLLRLLIDDAERVPPRLRVLLQHGNHSLARREAHALHGAAVSMGAADLVAALRAVESIPDGAQADPAIIDRVDRSAQSVIDAARAAMAAP
ncbi:PAS domain-containing protein [Sphingomonas sp. 2R-10]|uniref:PAS domain-containing protein n=1 Tax=Sphingomonas sp. 2R-10 TaxID=3045148 RepID=UPI0013DDFBCE|nr:PAS domain-containing protein [Sphingomonas sp. 2R-10]MDJ0278477.1 PAS domain-containing protein [Sphingomonas sp. 2R-10]